MQVGVDVKCILVGGACPVLEILLLSKTAKFPFQTMDYIVHGGQKNTITESAQKIHVSRGWCKMYARQAWWA